MRRGQAAILNRMVREGVREKVTNEDSKNEEIKPVDIWRNVRETERTSAKVLGQECLGFCRNSKGAMWQGRGEKELAGDKIRTEHGLAGIGLTDHCQDVGFPPTNGTTGGL